jgi:thiol-disulfide isomerase/thioredoxin
MKTRGLRYFGAALVVLLGIWAGLKVHPQRASRNVGIAVPAGVASAPEPREIAEAVDTTHPIVPAKLPQFALKDLGGKIISVSSWEGKSLMINFWATWCAPCRREIPLLKALAGDWADRDVRVVGIAVDYPDKVRQFANEFKIAYPVLVGEQDAMDVAADFGMASPGFPFTVFTDKRGQVVALFLGELHRPQAEFILLEVQKLNQDRIQLPEARETIAEGLDKMAAKPLG